MKDVNQIVQEFDRITAQLPIDQMLTELQIVVERLSFSQIQTTQNSTDSNVSIAHINMLFQDEISTEMLEYVQWVREHNMLSALTDKNGLLFLNYSIKKYKQMTQVRFITAIPISNGLKIDVKNAMLRLYPSGARLIFETRPSLVAGFVIEDGSNTVNRSLKHTMLSSLRTRVMQTNQGSLRG